LKITPQFNYYETPEANWRKKIYTIIFEADTHKGRLFDIVLLCAIFVSVLVVVLETIPTLHREYFMAFYIVEWVFTILFSIEYILRLLSVKKPLLYATSFMGLVDLLAVLPTFLSLFIVGSQYLMVIRIIRLVRIFRIFKLVHFLNEAQMLGKALRDSVFKIIVFIGVVVIIVLIFATLIFIIEGPENGFTSIPMSMYWTIVTITTVGYGDIAPQTVLGRSLASIIMLMGYAIIAVPTGIVTAQFTRKHANKSSIKGTACPNCSKEGHDSNADFCKYCGFSLE
tara:strand:- start:1438 stop:2286 length:849 start_codon:yes stop_codon:yes gene_type:complete